MPESLDDLLARAASEAGRLRACALMLLNRLEAVDQDSPASIAIARSARKALGLEDDHD